jgi:hypothetical protein
MLDENGPSEMFRLKIERKNSLITEPGSPLRKKKKIKKIGC